MKREMWIRPGEVQRFQVVTDVNKMCERVIESNFSTREEGLRFLEENRPNLDLRGITGVFPYARKAQTPGEETEAKAWQRLQATENNCVE